MAFTWFDYFCSPVQSYYWFTMLSCPDQWGDSLVGSYITVTWLGYTYWTLPTLPILLAIKCPVALIYGEYDLIMPVHQGLTILRMTDSNVHCFIVPRAGHNPAESPSFFVKAVFLAVEHLVVNGDMAMMLSRYIQNINWKTYSSSLNKWATNRTIQELYRFLDVKGITHGKLVHLDEVFNF